MGTQWLIEVREEANESVAAFLAEHGQTPGETEQRDVKCNDDRPRDMYLIPGGYVRRLERGMASFPQFKHRFWSRNEGGGVASPADWLKKKKRSKAVQEVADQVRQAQNRANAVNERNGKSSSGKKK